MSTFEIGGGVARGVACRRVAAVALLGAYAVVFAWPVATTTARPAVVAAAPSFLDELFGGGRCASVVPAFQNGRSVGLKLLSVRPGTAPFAAGLRSGDVLVGLDGVAVTSPDGVLAAYERVRFARAFGVDVLRGGEPVRIVVDVVPDHEVLGD